MNIYIVANSKALTLLEQHNIQHTMNTALTQAYGHTVQTTVIDTTTLDATNIDSNTSYKDIPNPIQTHQTTIQYTKPHNRKWNPKDFVYTNGSQVKCNNTLGARVVNPRTKSVTYIDIKSQKERHTIKRAKLAAITLALRRKKHTGPPQNTHRWLILHKHNKKLHNRPIIL